MRPLDTEMRIMYGIATLMTVIWIGLVIWGVLA